MYLIAWWRQAGPVLTRRLKIGFVSVAGNKEKIADDEVDYCYWTHGVCASRVLGAQGQ